jgi:hypothetical protein
MPRNDVKGMASVTLDMRNGAGDYITSGGARAGLFCYYRSVSLAFLKTTTSVVTFDVDPFIVHPPILKMSANGTAINLDQRSYAFFSLLTFHSDAY